MSEQAHDPELRAVEAALGALTPIAGTLNRDALLFRAGQQVVSRRPWPWVCSTAALSVLAAALSMGVLFRSPTQVVERIVYVPAPPTGALVSTPPTPDHPREPVSNTLEDEAEWREHVRNLKLRQQVLRWGIETLPPASLAGSARKPLTIDTLLEPSAEETPKRSPALPMKPKTQGDSL